MRNLLVALGVLSLTAMACTKSDESLQTNQSEIQSRRHSTGSGGSVSSIPAPTGLTANATSSTQINLTWNSVPGATTYWIYRDNVGSFIIPGTSYSDGSVKPGTTYTYAVAAVVNSVLGPKSASVSVTTSQ